MMKESFYFSAEVTDLLFKGWNSATPLALFGMCVATGGMVLFLEVLKLMMTFLSKTSTTVVSQGSPLIAPDNGEAPLSPFVDSTAAKHRKRLRILSHAGSSFLHMIYIVMAYCIMLAVMTYNSWILISVAVACGVGYFVFDALRSTLEGKSGVNLAPPEPAALSVDNIEPSLS